VGEGEGEVGVRVEEEEEEEDGGQGSVACQEALRELKVNLLLDASIIKPSGDGALVAELD